MQEVEGSVFICCEKCEKPMTPEEDYIDFHRKGFMTVRYHPECWKEEIDGS